MPFYSRGSVDNTILAMSGSQGMLCNAISTMVGAPHRYLRVNVNRHSYWGLEASILVGGPAGTVLFLAAALDPVTPVWEEQPVNFLVDTAGKMWSGFKLIPAKFRTTSDIALGLFTKNGDNATSAQTAVMNVRLA